MYIYHSATKDCIIIGVFLGFFLVLNSNFDGKINVVNTSKANDSFKLYSK